MEEYSTIAGGIYFHTLIEAFSKFDDSLSLSANSQPSNQAGSTKALCAHFHSISTKHVRGINHGL